MKIKLIIISFVLYNLFCILDTSFGTPVQSTNDKKTSVKGSSQISGRPVPTAPRVAPKKFKFQNFRPDERVQLYHLKDNKLVFF